MRIFPRSLSVLLISSLILVSAGCAGTPPPRTPFHESYSHKIQSIGVEPIQGNVRAGHMREYVALGKGQAAGRAIGQVGRGAPSDEGALLWLLLLPVMVPTAAIVGAAKGRAKEDVEADLQIASNILESDPVSRMLSDALANIKSPNDVSVFHPKSTTSGGDNQSGLTQDHIMQIQIRTTVNAPTGEINPNMTLHVLLGLELQRTDDGAIVDATRFHEIAKLGSLDDFAADEGKILKQTLEEISSALAQQLSKYYFLPEATGT